MLRKEREENEFNELTELLEKVDLIQDEENLLQNYLLSFKFFVIKIFFKFQNLLIEK